MERSGLISQNPVRVKQRPKDVGSVLFLRPYQPVKIKKCWRTPKEPFRVLTWFSVVFMGMGICIGYLFFHSISTIQQNREIIQLTALEKAELERDLERVQVINRESTRNMLALVSKIQAVMNTTYGDMEKRTFLLSIIPYALKHQAEDQIPASALIAMAIYESNYGRSELAREHFNYFGIKAWKSTWKGEVAYMSTVDSGRRTMANFRSYPGFEEGVSGYAQFILNSQRYRKAFHYSDGPSFVRELLHAGYCPDHDYLDHIKIIMARHQLNQLDLPHLMPDTAAETQIKKSVSSVR
ncbi:MAG: glucosaminidase domain-containing protein [Verrucomicrobiota bacterium]